MSSNSARDRQPCSQAAPRAPSEADFADAVFGDRFSYVHDAHCRFYIRWLAHRRFGTPGLR
jgi:hypothetical protein